MSQAAPGLSRLSLGSLIAIGTLYGVCGGALSGMHVTLMTSEEACLGPWSDQLLCNPDVTWAISTVVCVVVPVLCHALLLPQLRGRLRDRCLVGAVSVVAAVVVTFGCWRLLLDVPLLWAGWQYLVLRYGSVVLVGLLLSPVGVVLGAVFRPRRRGSRGGRVAA